MAPPDVHLRDEQLLSLARQFNVEARALRAVIKVESGGSGFLPDGRPKILLEGHYVWRRLETRGISPAPLNRARPDLCFKRWSRKHYRGGEGEWERLHELISVGHRIDPKRWESYKKAAYESASWGLFQLMGANYGGAGFDSVYQFVEAHRASAFNQLEAILTWMEAEEILPLLRRRAWTSFVARYNGPGQVPVYLPRLLKAYKNAAWAP